MKITPIKIAAVAIVLTSLSFASCRSAGYGCDYGAIEPNKSNEFESEVCLEERADENLLISDYRKISKP